MEQVLNLRNYQQKHCGTSPQTIDCLQSWEIQFWEKSNLFYLSSWKLKSSTLTIYLFMWAKVSEHCVVAINLDFFCKWNDLLEPAEASGYLPASCVCKYET